MKRPNKYPFKTPEGYFEDFSNRILDRLSEDATELPASEASPKGGFVVPDGYFQGLHGRISQKITAENTEVIPLHPYKKYFFVAASIAAIALISVVALQLAGKPNITPNTITFESIGDSEIETYFDEEDQEFSPYDIAEVLPVDQLEISDMVSERIDGEDVLEYLDHNTDTFEELNYDYDE